MKIFENFMDNGNSDLPTSTQLVAAKLLCGLIEACTENGRLYSADDNGRIDLIEESDSPAIIHETLGYSIEDASFEPGYMKRGFYITSILSDDEYGLTVMIPDGDWLGEDARRGLREVCGG